MIVLRVLSFLLGVTIIGGTLTSALRTVVLPRRGFTRITRFVFAVVHRLLVHRWGSESSRRSLTALFAPVSLVSLPLVWMLASTGGFTFLFWGVGVSSFSKSFTDSGSSLFTLGFSVPEGAGRIWLTFVEATIGLGLVALLISYLPTIYAAYNEREKGIKVLRPFAGTPPWAPQLLEGLLRADLVATSTVWTRASAWVLDLEQSHTSFPALCYFPSQSEDQSWIASFGTVLDGAALVLASSMPGDAQSSSGAAMVLAYGVPAARRIGRAASIPVEAGTLLTDVAARWHEPAPQISISRAEFDEVCARLAASGVLAAVDPEVAWRRFAWTRSGYDKTLRALTGLTSPMAAPWTTDRPARVGRPRLVGQRDLAVDWTINDG